MKKFNVGEYKFYLREKMPWKVYRGAQTKLAEEYGLITTELDDGAMKTAHLKFGLDLAQKVEDYYVPKLIKKVVKGDEEFITVGEIQEIMDLADASDINTIYDYCIELYEAEKLQHENSKKKN